MATPFVLRVPSPDLASRLVPLLRARGAEALVETWPGADVTVGLRELDAPPRWVSRIPARDLPGVVAFLERWGFIPRGAPPAP